MPDVFDSLDVFDHVASQPKGDVFDSLPSSPVMAHDTTPPKDVSTMSQFPSALGETLQNTVRLPMTLIGRAAAGAYNAPLDLVNTVMKAIGLTGWDKNQTVARFGPGVEELGHSVPGSSLPFDIEYPETWKVTPGQPMGLLEKHSHVIKQALGIPSTYSPGTKFANSDIDPVDKLIEGLVNGFQSPEGVALVNPFTGGALAESLLGKIALSGLASEQGVQGMQSALQPGEDWRTRLAGVGQVGLAATIARHGMALEPTPTVPPDRGNANLSYGDITAIEGHPYDPSGYRAPASRQIGDTQPIQEPPFRYTGDGMSVGGPHYMPEVAGGVSEQQLRLPEFAGPSYPLQTKFAVDPSGQALDLSQLTPQEQTEAMRGPRVYSPREARVRPAQQTPPILEQRPSLQIGSFAKTEAGSLVRITGIDRFGSVEFKYITGEATGESNVGMSEELFPIKSLLKTDSKIVGPYSVNPSSDIIPSYQSAGEPKSGGQVSFAGDAGQLPTARQQATLQPTPTYAVEPSPESVTGPGGPYSVPTVPPTAERLAAQSAKRGMKEGMTIPEQQVEQPTEAPESTSIPQQPGTVLSNLQLSRLRAAVARGASPEVLRNILRSPEGTEPTILNVGPEGATKPKPEGGKLYGGLPWLDPDYWKSVAKTAKGQLTSSAVRIALTPKEIGFTDLTKPVDAQQLKNRLRNKLNPTEWEMVKDILPDEGKISPNEAAYRMNEEGPKVEVRKFGGDNKSPEQAELSELTHYLETKHGDLDVPFDYLERGKDLSDFPNLDKTDISKFKRWFELKNSVGEQSGMDANWSSVTPTDVSNKGYVEVAVVRPVKGTGRLAGNERGDAYTAEGEYIGEGQRGYNEAVGIKFPSSHSFPPNTLGFGRAHEETLPVKGNGLLVNEVQSDWAQQVRDRTETLKKNAQAEGKSVEQYLQENPELKQGREGDPLLPHHERLVLKALIDHAREKGLKWVGVQDAESAMMMEGHDLAARHPGLEDEGAFEEGHKIIDQEKGMRLHYDRTLPKIMEELTEQKGEKTSFGEHRMAFNLHDANERVVRFHGQDYTINGDPLNRRFKTEDEALDALNEMKLEPRKDLIFRNPDGTPKTDYSGLVYDISKIPAEKSFSLTEKDRPEQMGVRLYGGLPPFDPNYWKGVGKGLNEAKAELVKGKKKFSDWISKSLDEPRPLGWSPYFQATKEERAQAMLQREETRPLNYIEQKHQQPGSPSSLPHDLANKLRAIGEVANQADKVLFNSDVLADYLDKGKATYDGTLHKTIIWPTDDHYQVELDTRDNLLQPIKNLVKNDNLTRQNSERVGVYMMAQQEGGRARMIESGINPTVIDNIVSTMSPAEMRLAKMLRKQDDELFPQIAAVAKSADNIELSKVENHFAWQRDFGKYKEQPDKVVGPKEGDKVDDAVQWLKTSYPNQGTKTPSGFTIEREARSKSPIKINALEVWDKHVRDVAHYLAMRQFLKDTGEIVRRPEFAAKYGKMGQDMMLEHLNRVALQGRNARSLPIVDMLRKKLGVGVLAYRLGSQFVHLANIPLAIQRTGPIWWGKGVYEAATDRGQAFLKKNFGETFERGGGEPALVELQSAQTATGNMAQKGWEGFKQGGFWIQRAIDQHNAQATVLGIYMRKLSEKGLDSSQYDSIPIDRQAVAEARTLSRRAVASPIYKDLPNVLGKGSWVKTAMQFQNTFLDQWSNARYDFPEYLRNDPAKAATLAVALASMVAIEAGVKLGAKKAVQAVTTYQPKQDDNEYWHQVQHELSRRLPYSQFIPDREFASTGVPAIDTLRDVALSGKDIYAARQAGDQKSQKIATAKAITSAAEISGIPGAGQIGQAVQQKMKAGMFKSHEQRVADVAQGMYGKSTGLTPDQRVDAEAKYVETREPLTRQEKESSAASAIRSNEARGARVQAQLPKDQQAWLEQNKLLIPGHSDSIGMDKQKVGLQKDELAYYEKQLVQQYQDNLKFLQTDKEFASLPQTEKQAEFSKAMSEARKEARGMVEEYIYSKKR